MEFFLGPDKITKREELKPIISPTTMWNSRTTESNTYYSMHECSDNDAHPGEAHGLLTETVQLRVVQLVKHSALNHLILPPDGDRTGAEPLEEQFIFGVKFNVLNLRGVL